jgi:hypothetical protein
MGMNGVGHPYVQTNEIRYCAIRPQRPADDTITKAERR